MLDFSPESAYYCLTAMSERAMVYSTEPLKHRHLVLYEAAGMGEDASYFIRSLLSEGQVRYETVERTAGGLKARLIEREGPTGLLLTLCSRRHFGIVTNATNLFRIRKLAPLHKTVQVGRVGVRTGASSPHTCDSSAESESLT